MRRDEIRLTVGGHRYTHFERYRVESDLFKADDAFELTLADIHAPVKAGDRCQLHVNGVLELNGIVDKRHRSYTKSGTGLTLSGRDLMGLLVDTHVGVGRTEEQIELKALAEKLLADVPFIGRKSIIYSQGSKERAVALDAVETFEHVQIEPTRSIFDELSRQAMARGLLFYCMPDGTFVFGIPRRQGKAAFSLVCNLSGAGNNIIEGEETDDLSQRYSEVHVIGQVSADESLEPGDTSVSGTSRDAGFPFKKPFYAELTGDGREPAKHAALIMNQQRFQGRQLVYKVPGHSQDGRNWQVNEFVRVKDEVLGISGSYLIYSRAFERSKEGGTTTTLKLSEPGVMPL